MGGVNVGPQKFCCTWICW